MSCVECTDHVVLLSDDSRRLQMVIDRLNDNVSKFGLHFAPPKCKMLLQD